MKEFWIALKPRLVQSCLAWTILAQMSILVILYFVIFEPDVKASIVGPAFLILFLGVWPFFVVDVIVTLLKKRG